MNKQQAESQQLIYHGAYNQGKEVIKTRAQELRRKGYRAVVVDIPASKYSRGSHSMGYALYVEKKFFNDERINELNKWISDIPRQKADALSTYNTKLAELDANEKAYERERNTIVDTKNHTLFLKQVVK